MAKVFRQIETKNKKKKKKKKRLSRKEAVRYYFP